MNIFTTCAILALGAIKGCSAFASGGALEARAGPIGRFYFEGPFVSYGLYADFRQNVPEDGNAYPISTYLKLQLQTIKAHSTDMHLHSEHDGGVLSHP